MSALAMAAELHHDHMRAELVADALNAAVRTRGGQVNDPCNSPSQDAGYQGWTVLDVTYG